MAARFVGVRTTAGLGALFELMRPEVAGAGNNSSGSMVCKRGTVALIMWVCCQQ